METFDKSAGDGTTPGSVEQSGNSPAVPSGCVRFTSDDFDRLIDELFDATAVLVALEARIFELEGGELNPDDATELRRVSRVARDQVTRVANRLFGVQWWNDSHALGTFEAWGARS